VTAEASATPRRISARRHFRWCVAAIFLPVVTVPFEWALAVRHLRRRDATSQERRWSRRLLALAITDTVIAALVLALIASGVWRWSDVMGSRTEPASGGGWVGVTIVPNPDKRGETQISRVVPDSPAARAGLRTGDVIVAVDGAPVRSPGDLTLRVRSAPPGLSRTFRITRAGQESDVVVVPGAVAADARPPAVSVFSVSPTTSCVAEAFGSTRNLGRWRGLWAGSVLILVLWLVGRRIRPMAPPLWSWLVLALASGVLVESLGSVAFCVAAGGWTIGGVLVSSLVSRITALVIGLVAWRHMLRAGLLDLPADSILPAWLAIVRGLFYAVCANIRLGIVGAALDALVGLRSSAATVETAVAQSLGAVDVAGQVLMVLSLVVIGPAAEEVLFRGVMLPRLTEWFGVGWALVATSVTFAVLHEGAGHEPFGLRAAGVIVIALALGWARIRTRGLTAPIVMHMLVNALVLLLHL